MARPTVAHFHDTFFLRSETFVYNVVTAHDRFEALCVAREFSNLDAFPFPQEKCFYFPRRTRSFADKVLFKAFGMDLPTERWLRQKDARLIHAHFGPNGFAALPLKKRLKLPLVTSFYGYDAAELGQLPEWRARYKRLFAEGELFLVEGECMKGKLIALGCPADKVRLQRIAIPLERIPFRARTRRAGEKAVIIFTGRFVEKKGLLDALEALRRVRERRKDFELRIIGDGPLKGAIESFIRSHAMEDYVKTLGFLNYARYLDEMARADIFLQPSITAKNGDDEGGAPTTILEAQAMGMPILATKHADIPNIVEEGKSALLSAEHDAEGLAQNIERLLDSGDWEAMGKAGRRFVETRHGLEDGVAKLEALYSALVNPS